MEIISTKTKIDFMGKRRITTVLSMLLILAGIFSLFSRGLNLGIDFTGGVLLEVGYTTPADLGDIRSRLENGGFDAALVQNFGTATDVLIRVMPAAGVDSAQVGGQILGLLAAGDSNVELRRAEFVGPQVGKELTERGGLAMLFAVIMILLYIMIRFQWKFAVGSVAALLHDVLITIGIFSIFRFPFDLSVLAAILAVIGYSLNDTIVVFDRIRENFRLIKQQGAEAIMNTSINQMLGRTMITSLTTLLVLFALLLLGGEAVRGFSLALIIGIFIGTYSSIYTASATALVLDVTTDDLIPPKVDKESVDDLP
jgi:preprotein translocase subunit SecF